MSSINNSYSFNLTYEVYPARGDLAESEQGDSLDAHGDLEETQMLEGKIYSYYKELKPASFSKISPSSPFENLPFETLLATFQYLSKSDLCQITKVSKTMNIVGSDVSLWNKIGQKTIFNLRTWEEWRDFSTKEIKNTTCKYMYALINHTCRTRLPIDLYVRNDVKEGTD